MSSREDWIASNNYLRDVLIQGDIINLSPLRIGAGKETVLVSPIDLSVIRVNLNGIPTPYIPGSSLKGIFRSQATALSRSKGLNVCSGLSKETCMDTKVIGGVPLRQFVDWNLRAGNVANALRAFASDACLLCHVFGAPSYASKVNFSDAYPIEREGVRLGSRTGIAIDRKTGAVFHQALYTVEYVEPGARFSLSIHCRNIPNYALGLISSIIKLVNDGSVRVGGLKSRGFGLVKIENLSFSIKDAQGSEAVLRALDECDSEVDISGLRKERRDGYVVIRGGECERLMDALQEVWRGFKGYEQR
ncbi:MAG: CRISPR-associated RAMP protein Csx7 [Aigarchaeota archaeon]|nr:CRISPR-associated RAMP protein Csx7 [Candidatus Pelearchaeum maunauluense]